MLAVIRISGKFLFELSTSC